MSIIPSGFTPITTDYKPYDYPPDVTGLINDKTPLLIDGKISLTTQESVNNNSYINVINTTDYVLTAQINKPYLRPGDTFTVTCNISRLNNNTEDFPSILLRLYNPFNNVIDLPDNAYIANVLSAGVATITGVLGLNTSQNINLQFVAHIATSNTIPPLVINLDELNKLGVKSNIITVNVLESNTGVNTIDPPIPPYIPPIPLHDSVITNLGTGVKNTVIDQKIDLIPVNNNLRGSSGEGIYSDVGIISPNTVSLNSVVPAEGIQRLLGNTVNQINRISSWATQLLKLINSGPNPLSEANVLYLAGSSSIKDAIDRYRQLVDQSGKYTTDISTAAGNNYANGNVINKTNSIEQHNVGQYRLASTSVFDVNSPSVTITSQHTLYTSRFYHLTSDLYQASHQHCFVRAEDQYSVIGNTVINFAEKELLSVSANHTNKTGNRNEYSDTSWVQTGQVTALPFHLTNTQTGNYGSKVELVMNNYNLLTTIGDVVVNATKDINCVAKLGDVVLTSAVRNVSISSTLSTVINSKARVSIRSIGFTTITSKSALTLKGSIVFINSNAIPSVDVTMPPVILTHLPKIFLNMTSPMPYIKADPLTPGPVGQKVPKTPEPNSIQDGSFELGRYLTSSP